MKRLLFISTLVLMVSAAVAQPPQRRAEQHRQHEQEGQGSLDEFHKNLHGKIGKRIFTDIHPYYSTTAEKSQEEKCAVFLKIAQICGFLSVRRRGWGKSSGNSEKNRDRVGKPQNAGAGRFSPQERPDSQ